MGIKKPLESGNSTKGTEKISNFYYNTKGENKMNLNTVKKQMVEDFNNLSFKEQKDANIQGVLELENICHEFICASILATLGQAKEIREEFLGGLMETLKEDIFSLMDGFNQERDKKNENI